MLVELLLDQKPYYTAYDTISGTIAVRSSWGTDCEEIVVKLECESISRVVPDHQGARTGHGSGSVLSDDQKRTNKFTEMHKTLYRTQRVWPTPDLLEDGPQRMYRLEGGEHAFPFQLQFPSRNTCTLNDPSPPLFSRVNPLERMIIPTHHVRRSLPPLLAVDSMAEIRYYLKVTVKRPHFKSIRLERPIQYIPPGIPPSPLIGRAYTNQNISFPPASSSNRRGGGNGNGNNNPTLFSQFSPSQPRPLSGPTINTLSSSGKLLPSQFPSFTAHLSLPATSVLACGNPIDLQLEIEQMSEIRGHSLYLDSIDISIVAFTNLTAFGCQAMETSNFVIWTKARINLPIDNRTSRRADIDSSSPAGGISNKGGGSDDNGTRVGTRHILPPSLWSAYTKVPSKMTPSFSTCNIERSYSLEVRIGLAHFETPDSTVPLVRSVALSLPFVLITGIVPTNVPVMNSDDGAILDPFLQPSYQPQQQQPQRAPSSGSEPPRRKQPARGGGGFGTSPRTPTFAPIPSTSSTSTPTHANPNQDLRRPRAAFATPSPSSPSYSAAITGTTSTSNTPSTSTASASAAAVSVDHLNPSLDHHPMMADTLEDEMNAPPPSYAEAMEEAAMETTRSLSGLSLAAGSQQQQQQQQQQGQQQQQYNQGQAQAQGRRPDELSPAPVLPPRPRQRRSVNFVDP